jgi:hypothetical protein
MTDLLRLSRREFATIAGVALTHRPGPSDEFEDHGPQGAASARPSADAIFERVKAQIGGVWRPDTVDGIKAGDSTAAITGLVTSAMATMAVLQGAVKAQANLVVTLEPTFYGSADARVPQAIPQGGGPAPMDAVYAAKNEFIDRHRLFVMRLRDHWRARRPDPMAEGLGDVLGWAAHRAVSNPSRYEIKAVRLGALASYVKRRLGARGGVRVIGAPGTSIRKVALLPGSTPLAAAVAAMPQVDVVIAGEVREWESVEYARDAVYSGQPKGLILVGRIVSAEPGMAACARWLSTVVPEVPVRHIAAGDPYWRPQ